jgi:hypothetical protein
MWFANCKQIAKRFRARFGLRDETIAVRLPAIGRALGIKHRPNLATPAKSLTGEPRWKASRAGGSGGPRVHGVYDAILDTVRTPPVNGGHLA